MVDDIEKGKVKNRGDDMSGALRQLKSAPVIMVAVQLLRCSVGPIVLRDPGCEYMIDVMNAHSRRRIFVDLRAGFHSNRMAGLKKKMEMLTHQRGIP
jgi:hypothetical protein